MCQYRRLAAILLVFTLQRPSQLNGQIPVLSAPTRGAAYPELRTWHEQRSALSLTEPQQIEMLRDLVRSGRHAGQRRLDRMFGNFAGTHYIDPTIPGLGIAVRQVASANRSVAKGASRTIVYAQQVFNDPHFSLVRVNEPVNGPDGRTDKDLHYKHKATGLDGRMEVKEVSIGSQRTNLVKYKRQIAKMANEYHRTGELQCWVNRHEVIPEIKRYAEEHHVNVYEDVGTGRGAKTQFRNVLFREHLRFWQAKLNSLGGVTQVGAGVVLLCQSLPAVYEDLVLLRDSPVHSEEILPRLGEHASLAIADGARMTASGMASAALAFPHAVANSTRLMFLSRWSGRLGFVAVVVAEGFVVWQYHCGILSERQLFVMQANLAGSLLGGAAGGWIGYKTGLLVGGTVGFLIGGPPGAVLGAFIGGAVGTIAGSLGGGYLGFSWAHQNAKSYYDFKDKQQEQRFQNWLYTRYGLE